MSRKISMAKMNLEESISSSMKLAKMVERTGFIPIGVIGITTGGVLPAKILSDYFKCPLILISVARPMTSLKKYFFLNKLPRSAKSFLRKMEMSLGFYRIMGRRTIDDISGELSPGKYVIVDDSLDTGKTIRKVLTYLEKRKQIFRRHILIAVLNQLFDDANPPADCHLYKNLSFTFPWSQDSNEYDKFVELNRTIHASLEFNASSIIKK